jgi:hypothetical protein
MPNQAVPLIAEELKALKALVQRSQQQHDTLATDVATHLQPLTSGGLTVKLLLPRLLPRLLPLLLPRPAAAAMGAESRSQYASAQASIVTTPFVRSPSPRPPPLQQSELAPSRHGMCREVRSVGGLWREWTVGLQDQPSVEELDRGWAAGGGQAARAGCSGTRSGRRSSGRYGVECRRSAPASEPPCGSSTWSSSG